MELIDRFKCNNIECHIGRDILDSIWEAIHQTPACGLNAILCGAAQEIDALRADGWISVDDRLPEKEGEYLWARKNFFSEDGYQLQIVRYSPNANPYHQPIATHWQPLPSPPKEET